MTSVQEMILWGVAILLMLVLPTVEFARSQRARPRDVKLTRNAAIISTIGVLMALWLFMYV